MSTDSFLFFFFIAISFSGILCAIVLLILNKVERHANRLLALGLLNISIVLVLNGLTYVDGFYIAYPHSYRIGVFTQYLLAPFFYLYLRATIRREGQFYKWDWLHFVPAILHFIEFIPFYLIPTAEKTAYLKYAFSHIEILSMQKEGFLPANLHPILKTGTGIVYEFFQIKLLLFSYMNNRKWLKKNVVVWNWLVRLTLFHSLTYVFVFVSFILYRSQIDMRMYSILSLGLVQFFCTVTLMFNPRVLYGMKENLDVITYVPMEEVGDTVKDISKRKSISESKIIEYMQKLEQFMIEEKPYFKKKYAIREFAADCNIPVHDLSAVINSEYHCSYTEFINKHRVEFIIANRYDENWSSFSLEGLASEAGFNSRNSFFIAFKKITGQTPSAYFSDNKGTIS